jgi:hypothetical protein
MDTDMEFVNAPVASATPIHVPVSVEPIIAMPNVIPITPQNNIRPPVSPFQLQCQPKTQNNVPLMNELIGSLNGSGLLLQMASMHISPQVFVFKSDLFDKEMKFQCKWLIDYYNIYMSLFVTINNKRPTNLIQHEPIVFKAYDVSTLEMLHQLGYNLMARDIYNKTLFHFATNLKTFELAKSKELPLKDNSLLPNHQCILCCNYKSSTIIKYIIANFGLVVTDKCFINHINIPTIIYFLKDLKFNPNYLEILSQIKNPIICKVLFKYIENPIELISNIASPQQTKFIESLYNDRLNIIKKWTHLYYISKFVASLILKRKIKNTSVKRARISYIIES